MKYTHSSEADEIVERELKTIKKIILKKIPGIISIILFGSFGRGEGSYIRENGKIELIGDYDMYIITKKRVNEDFLEKISEECAKSINAGNFEIVKNINQPYERKRFFHVDIRNVVYNKLRKLLPMQRTIDLKNSRVIYGENLLNKIPDVELSLSEALRPLFNRANYLLASSGREKEVKAIASIKAIIDSCSCLLMAEKKYDSRCKNRNQIFQQLDFPARFKKLVDKATKLKLEGHSNKNPDKLWEESKEFLGYSLKYILKKQSRKNLETWKEIGDYIAFKLPYTYFNPYILHYFHSKYFFPVQYYMNLKFILACWKTNERIVKPFFTWKDAGLKLAASLITYLYGNQKLSEKYLKKITNNTYPLKQRILKVYAVYFLQRLR
jgi:hypothetical protein